MTLDSRERWIKAAVGWEARADQFARDTMPVSLAMVEAIQPHPGQTILDLAAGLGDTGFLAAELIEPGGQLITSDFSPEMLSAAQRRAKVSNVRFRQMDLSTSLDQAAASIDGVLCRWGYMLLEDPEAALKETRRILKQDGRLALAAWTGPDDNLWSAAPTRALQQRGLVSPPQGPGQFTWADPNLIVETMEASGFIEPQVDAVDFVMRFADFDDWWTHITLTSGAVGEADQKLDFATRSDVLADLEKIAEPFTQPDDRLEIPARTWVATATASHRRPCSTTMTRIWTC
jgi:SAM-dependent methyltransferase